MSATEATLEYVTVRIGEQLFGVPVHEIREVFSPQGVTAVPRARPEIAGLLNLRGRIVTAIDARRCLGLPPRATLSQISERLEGRPDELRSAHTRLVARVGAVRELVELNAVVAGNALGRVDATLGLLGRLRPDRPVYTADPAAAPERVGRLVRSSA